MPDPGYKKGKISLFYCIFLEATTFCKSLYFFNNSGKLSIIMIIDVISESYDVDGSMLNEYVFLWNIDAISKYICPTL